MRNVKAWWVLGLIWLGGTAVSQVQQGSGPAEKAVLALENRWVQSEQENDVDLVAPLLADKFIYTGTDGTMSDRAAFLALLKATNWIEVRNQDVKATAFGDTVIVTGLFKAKGSVSGKPIFEHTRYTDVWVRMPTGKWQCVSSQDSPTTM